MLLDNINEINNKVLDNLQLYAYNNIILNNITLNNYQHSVEEIELIKDEIISKNEKDVEILQKQIPTLKQSLRKINFHNDLLVNVCKLEVEVNKFWFKFNLKFKSNQKATIEAWREKFLLSCKENFFLLKEKNQTMISKWYYLDVKEINNNKKDHVLKNNDKLNSIKI